MRRYQKLNNWDEKKRPNSSQNGLEQVRRGCTSLTEVLQVAGSAGGERE